MATAYDPTEWHDLFVATAGASAALAGLLFVAVSINVDRIIKYEGLPARGVETLALLLSGLIVSIAGLLPGQSHVALGLELAFIVAALGFTLAALPIVHEIPDEAPPNWLLTRWLVRVTGRRCSGSEPCPSSSSSPAGSTGSPPGSSSPPSAPSPMPGFSWSRSCAEPCRRRRGVRPAGELARMGRCADPTNAATPSSPATSGTSPGARSRS